MYKKGGFFITFEGIEGSGKTFHCRILFKKLKQLKYPTLMLREPGGTYEAENIRKLILSESKKKFDKLTDTLLYLASRNENYKKNILPNIKKNKFVLCDRYLDSTIAYQHYGFGVNKFLINKIHKEIMGSKSPNLTFLFIINEKIALKRIMKRKMLNRYDKFSKSFYKRVQDGYLKIASSNKKRFVIINTNQEISDVKKLVFEQFLKFLKNKK